MKKLLLFELLIPLLLFAAVNQIVFNVIPVVRFLDEHRPRPFGVDLSVYFQAQDFHARALTIADSRKNRIVFTGSSSVVEGIDVEIIRDIFLHKKFPLHPYNYGQIGMKAYELPLLKKYLLDNKISAVVYLYNTFSFPNTLPSPERTDQWQTLRWNTFEFLRFAGIDKLYLYRNVIGNGIARELFPVYKYDFLVKDYISRLLTGTLKPLDYPHSFLPDRQPPPSRRPRRLRPVKDTMWRRLYIQSDTDRETISYRNLARFLDLAAKRNIKVVLAPIPEPGFVDYGERQGINIKRIDDHVARIAAKKNMVFFPRQEIKHIEENDVFFADHAHMHSSGRNEYSKWLANKLTQVLDRRY